MGPVKTSAHQRISLCNPWEICPQEEALEKARWSTLYHGAMEASMYERWEFPNRALHLDQGVVITDKRCRGAVRSCSAVA